VPCNLYLKEFYLIITYKKMYTLHNSGLFFKHVEETMIKKEGKKIHDDDDNKSFIISSHANYGAKPMIKTKNV